MYGETIIVKTDSNRLEQRQRMISVLEAIRILDLDRSVKPTKIELKKAYRRKSLLTHPDKGGSAADFIQVQIAYELLSDDAILNSFCFSSKQNEFESSEHIQSLIIQICKKYASGMNPTVLSNIAASINLVSNLFFDDFSHTTSHRARQRTEVEFDEWVSEHQTRPNDRERAPETARSPDAERPIDVSSEQSKSADIYLELSTELCTGSDVMLTVKYSINIIRLELFKDDMYRAHIAQSNDKVVLDIHQIRADIANKVVDADNYLVFQDKGNEWITEQGSIRRGTLYIDMEVA